MDVIPQATPLYATDGVSEVVFLVIAWQKDADTKHHKVLWPVVAPISVCQVHAEIPEHAITLHPTLEEAQAALLRR